MPPRHGRHALLSRIDTTTPVLLESLPLEFREFWRCVQPTFTTFPFVYNGPALSSVGRVAFLFCLIPAISMGLQKQKVSPVNGCSAEGVEMACLRSEGHDKLRMGG